MLTSFWIFKGTLQNTQSSKCDYIVHWDKEPILENINLSYIAQNYSSMTKFFNFI